MSHTVDYVTRGKLRISDEQPYNAHFATIPYTTQAFNGNSPEMGNLPCVTLRLISKLDREYVVPLLHIRVAA